MKAFHFFRKAKKDSPKLPIPNALLSSLEQELLDPLSGLKGMHDLMSNTELSKKQRRYLSAMDDSIFKIEQIITTITQLAKEELSEAKNEAVHFNIYTLLETIFEVESAKNTHINLGYYLSRSVPHLVYGYDKKLEHLIKTTTQNLISKIEEQHNIEKDILLEVDVEFSDEQEVMLRLTFTTPKLNANALMPLDDFNTKILNQLMATITEQEHAELSIVRLKIPVKRAMSSQAQKQQSFAQTFPLEELKQAHVLIIDHAPLNTKIIAQTLRKYAVKNNISSNFPNAITMIEEAIKKENPYTHVLIDDELPSLTPQESAEYILTTISAHPQQLPPKLLLLSQKHGGRHKDNFQNLGYSYILTKPVREFSLLAYLCNKAEEHHSDLASTS